MVVIHKKHEETELEKEERIKHEQEKSIGIQDEFQAKGFELVSFAQKHKGRILSVVLLLLVAGFGTTGYFFMEKRKNEEASSALLEIVSLMEKQDFDEKNTKNVEEILEKLKKFSDEHKKSPVAALSRLHMGSLSLGQNKTKEAVESYSIAVSLMDVKHSLYPAAVIGLGYAYMADNALKESLDAFEKVIALKSGLGKDLALFESAKLLIAQNDNKKAKEYIEKLLEDFPASFFKSEADKLKANIQ